MQPSACQLDAVTKSFGPNTVLRGIDMSLYSGKVTVLMGANGAGKSTLVKVLSGVHRLDQGQMTLFGNDYRPKSPSDAIKQGVVTVHQSINDGVVPQLDVASNLALDRLAHPQYGFFVNKNKLYEQAQSIADSMQLAVDVTAPVAALGLADRQMIAIARAMAGQPKILILDEPTSSLSSKEADRLFDLIERLKMTGVAILYISHRMSDIRRVADIIVTMRDGLISGQFDSHPIDYSAAVKAMLGHDMLDAGVVRARSGQPVLELQDILIQENAAPIQLDAHENEVIAISGLLGSGKSRLAGVIFGIETALAGEMRLAGQPYRPKNAKQALQQGVYLCARDRASNGIVASFDITDNTTLPFYSRHSHLGFLNRSSQRKASQDMVNRLKIVCQSCDDNISTLSGGNQQKVMIARWLYQKPRVLLLDEPFQGVDIQARKDIGELIRASANSRTTLVFVSEIDEAMEIADRIVVLHENEIAGEHTIENVNLDALTAQMTGVNKQSLTSMKHDYQS